MKGKCSSNVTMGVTFPSLPMLSRPRRSFLSRPFRLPPASALFSSALGDAYRSLVDATQSWQTAEEARQHEKTILIAFIFFPSGAWGKISLSSPHFDQCPYMLRVNLTQFYSQPIASRRTLQFPWQLQRLVTRHEVMTVIAHKAACKSNMQVFDSVHRILLLAKCSISSVHCNDAPRHGGLLERMHGSCTISRA